MQSFVLYLNLFLVFIKTLSLAEGYGSMISSELENMWKEAVIA
jgi:hypothetical protein